MKCKILHETTGRLRVHLCCGRMTVSQADVLEYYLRAQDGVQAVKVYDRTQDAVVLYEAERGNIIRALAQFSFAKAEAMELVPEHTSRALNREWARISRFRTLPEKSARGTAVCRSPAGAICWATTI